MPRAIPPKEVVDAQEHVVRRRDRADELDDLVDLVLVELAPSDSYTLLEQPLDRVGLGAGKAIVVRGRVERRASLVEALVLSSASGASESTQRRTAREVPPRSSPSRYAAALARPSARALPVRGDDRRPCRRTSARSPG
jgi:hypothetical protein